LHLFSSETPSCTFLVGNRFLHLFDLGCTFSQPGVVLRRGLSDASSTARCHTVSVTQSALERGEELVAQIAAARAGKRWPVRRMR
jgi:hypothetical protein